MAKLLTNREMELFRLLVLAQYRNERDNPDVGMGPTFEAVARRVADRLTFFIDEDDLAEVCEDIRASGN
jgi:hypothetical protein